MLTGRTASLNVFVLFDFILTVKKKRSTFRTALRNVFISSCFGDRVRGSERTLIYVYQRFHD
jgi:hypothetical protein